MNREEAVEIYRSVRQVIDESFRDFEEIKEYLEEEDGNWWLHCGAVDMKIDKDGVSVYVGDSLMAYHSKDLIKLLTNRSRSSIVLS